MFSSLTSRFVELVLVNGLTSWSWLSKTYINLEETTLSLLNQRTKVFKTTVNDTFRKIQPAIVVTRLAQTFRTDFLILSDFPNCFFGAKLIFKHHFLRKWEHLYERNLYYDVWRGVFKSYSAAQKIQQIVKIENGFFAWNVLIS